MDTQEIANRLVELCRAGRFDEAHDELFSDDAENIEMPSMSEGPLGNAKGRDAMRAKSRVWNEGVEQMHGSSIGDPVVAGNWFSLPMSMDVTLKGRGRTRMDEICVYQVRDGKIVREQFFYDA